MKPSQMYLKVISTLAKSHMSENTLIKAVNLLGTEPGTNEALEEMYKLIQNDAINEEDVIEAMEKLA